MSTNLPQESAPKLSGDVSEFKHTVIYRGEVAMTMSGTSGSASVDLTPLFRSAGTAGMLKVEVYRWTSGGGLTSYYPLPYTITSGATVITNGYFSLDTSVEPGGNTLTLSIGYYQSTAIAGDIKYFHYTVYSKTATPYFYGLGDWDYNGAI